MSKSRFKLYGASYLVLVKDGQILLGRRQGSWGAGSYSLPAGHIDGQETMKQSIIREAKEETGIDIEPGDLEVKLVMHRNCGGESEYMDVFLQASKWTGEIRIMEPDKCDDLRFFQLDKMPSNTLDYILKALSCIQRDVHYIDYGW